MIGDADELRRVAEDCIRTRGPNAVAWLLEQAELAEAIKDRESAKSWREIAAVVEAIFQQHSNSGDPS